MKDSLYCGSPCRMLNRRRELLAPCLGGVSGTIGGRSVGTPARRHPPLTARGLEIARRDRELRRDAHAMGFCVGCHERTEIVS